MVKLMLVIMMIFNDDSKFKYCVNYILNYLFLDLFLLFVLILEIENVNFIMI